MSGPEFFQTRMGHRFYESTMPALVKQLELLNKNLENQPIPFLPTQAGRRFHSDRPNEANKPKSLWDYNEIQFARLLCEIRAACEMEGFDQVMESMDLDDEQMDELWRRAEEVWERSKATYCPPPKLASKTHKCPNCKMVLLEVNETDGGFATCPKCKETFCCIYAHCQNCNWSGTKKDLGSGLEDIPHLLDRIEPGGEVPAGVCPECGALAYIQYDEDEESNEDDRLWLMAQLDKIRPHLDHVDCLEVAWYGPKDNSEPANITVECAKCGEVVTEIYDLQMEADAGFHAEEDKLIDTLCAYFEQEKKVVDSELDDYVHDMASQAASNINNSSVREQLRYLLNQAGEKWMRETLLPVVQELGDAGEIFSELCEEAGIDGGEGVCENCGKPCAYHTEMCLCDECKRKAES